MKKLISYEIHFYLIRFQVLIQMKKRSKKMHMPWLDYSMKLIKPHWEYSNTCLVERPDSRLIIYLKGALNFDMAKVWLCPHRGI